MANVRAARYLKTGTGLAGQVRGRMGFRMALLVCGVLFLSPAVAFAAPVPSGELIENAGQYDGQAVTYRGEVIGDVMERGGFAWINVNDGENAVGVWLEKRLAKDIVYAGSYETRGDWVEISGIFHRACLQHGGDLDIHADTLRRIAAGEKTQRELSINKRNLAFILLGVLCLVLILRQLKTS